ncbi:hypothetical protein SAMN05444266_102314 [Chitinophaga jiangningensis]|uniref:Uncharacterized protein n=1 Tax=Chitinophaga jiangningensis TaxID=1419482 RepID=A0A1M6YHF7_9BACT|nr:hypothetical protein [Chitinophaga jiangningensis]SHL17550.1 hypothetical protein SAMN05444266_102314 [Chitinophaga jiangningensis]
MRRSLPILIFGSVVLMIVWLAACMEGQKPAKQVQQPPATVPARAVTDSSGGNISLDTTGDERKFRIALAVLQQAVKKNDEAQIKKCICFPLQTSLQWTNEELKTAQVDKTAGKVGFHEFSEYYPNIFHAAVKRLLPKAGEDNLQEIDEMMNEDYYNTLRQGTDKGSKLYEVYEQYPEKNGHAESFFAFVFGRVAGEYKVVAYYAKWPVKG